eukprot:826009_1
MGTTYCNCSTPSNSNESMLSQEAKAKQINCERRNGNNDTDDKVKQNKKMEFSSGGNAPLYGVPIDVSRSSSGKQRQPSIESTNMVANVNQIVVKTEVPSNSPLSTLLCFYANKNPLVIGGLNDMKISQQLQTLNLDNVSNTFHQPIGPVDNHYGELHAIGKTKKLMEQLNIDISNRRCIIFTDSLSNFLPLITTPSNPKKIKYKPLFQHTQRHIKSINAILWKIKSHTVPQQYFNECADI